MLDPVDTRPRSVVFPLSDAGRSICPRSDHTNGLSALFFPTTVVPRVINDYGHVIMRNEVRTPGNICAVFVLARKWIDFVIRSWEHMVHKNGDINFLCGLLKNCPSSMFLLWAFTKEFTKNSTITNARTHILAYKIMQSPKVQILFELPHAILNEWSYQRLLNTPENRKAISAFTFPYKPPST